MHYYTYTLIASHHTRLSNTHTLILTLEKDAKVEMTFAELAQFAIALSVGTIRIDSYKRNNTTRGYGAEPYYVVKR